MTIQTEFEFTLPRGYVDEMGQVHHTGRMRLATAMDEIEAVEHPGVRAKESYLPVLLLSRVVTQLGTLDKITPRVIASLFASDMAYLQDMYLRLNGTEVILVGAVCPHCNSQFQVQVAPLG
ncbi:MAG: phage tail assembly protein [Ardenticatenaceae bacterium]|nr:phage tail assembly protein [Ardenticatenaceae bacterium]